MDLRLANPLLFDLKSDGICRKITESQHDMFLHNNTSRLNYFLLPDRGGAGWGSVSFHESYFPGVDFTGVNSLLCTVVP